MSLPDRPYGMTLQLPVSYQDLAPSGQQPVIGGSADGQDLFVTE